MLERDFLQLAIDPEELKGHDLQVRGGVSIVNVDGNMEMPTRLGLGRLGVY